MKRKGLSKYAPYLSLGLEIAVGLAMPIMAGYWADQYFGTEPWLVLAGCVVGIISIFMIIYRLSDRLMNEK